MRLLFSIILLSAVSFNAQAQFTGHYNALNIAGSSNTLKSEIPLAQPAVIGSTYLDDNWQPAEIVLKSGYVIDQFPVKVEIEHANVEIQYNGEVKFLNIKEVDSVNLIDAKTGAKSVLKKANQFTYNDTPLQGVVMIQGKEPYGIVKHYYIEFLASNYNVAMDVGSKDHRKVKKEKVYISQRGKLILVKGSDKKIAAQLGPDKEKALNIIKEQKLRLSRDSDLVRFVTLMKS